MVLLLAAATAFGGEDGGPWPDPRPPAVRDESGNGIVVRQGRDGLLRLGSDRSWLTFDLAAGRFSAGRPGGDTVVENALAEVRSRPGRPTPAFRSTDGYTAAWTSQDAVTPLGTGKRVTVSLSGLTGRPDLELHFTLLAGFAPILLSTDLIARPEGPAEVAGILPIVAGADTGGGVRIGEEARDLRILENGFATLIDFYCRLEPGDQLTLSNWNTAVHDPAHGENLVLGGLTFENGEPLIGTAPGSDGGPALDLTLLNAFSPALPAASGERIASETFYLDFCSANPLEALEAYADAVKAWQGIRLWTERHPEIGVPSGWNSWSGSSGSGGYGTNIDAEIILANLVFMDRELRKWGMSFFPVDDGWQLNTGDWEPNPARFPPRDGLNGVEWILHEARRRGFHPGLWISPYNAHESSRLVAEHPDWMARKDLIGLFSVDDDMEVLDLTHPEVQAWLADVVSTLRAWGVEWLKLDFGYWFLMTRAWYQQGITRINGHRQAQQIVKEALGPDAFFLTVAVMGPNYGLADACRIGLDTMPVWEGEFEGDLRDPQQVDNQGIKPTVRTIERRYYLHDRIWVNHGDLLFFRAHADPRYPALTLDESRAMCQLVAYTGGIVKLGEKLVEMPGDAVAATRSVLPVYGRSGRPVDLFRREFAEVWSLAVDDFEAPYHTVGLFNWGENLDLTRVPYARMTDADRTIEVDFAELGLDPRKTYLGYEFWTGSFLGELSGSLALEVPARTARSVALREKLGRPQFLGTNRHVLGGVRVVEGIHWDGTSATLSGRQEGSVGTDLTPFTFHLAFHVPDAFTFHDVRIDVPEGLAAEGIRTESTGVPGGSLLRLSFTLRDTDGDQPAEVFPEISWDLHFDR